MSSRDVVVDPAGALVVGGALALLLAGLLLVLPGALVDHSPD